VLVVLCLMPVFFIRVPTLCDFEPLNHHVEVLHQLVQAAQSVDEMSQTITDLLNEQKVLCVHTHLIFYCWSVWNIGCCHEMQIDHIFF